MKTEKNRSRFNLEHWQKISVLMMIYDALAVNAAFYIALWLRYDCKFFDIPYFFQYITFFRIFQVYF